MKQYFEWDDVKNQSNQNKHGVPFEIIYEIFKDINIVQMVENPDKWEDLSILNKNLNIARNKGNLDPIRGKLIGIYDNKIYTAIYTFRGEISNIKYRIISIRRAHDNEENFYNECKGQ